MNFPELLVIFWANYLPYHTLTTIDYYLVEIFVNLVHEKSYFILIQIEKYFPFHK